jgi:hypothetical protein
MLTEELSSGLLVAVRLQQVVKGERKDLLENIDRWLHSNTVSYLSKVKATAVEAWADSTVLPDLHRRSTF